MTDEYLPVLREFKFVPIDMSWMHPDIPVIFTVNPPLLHFILWKKSPNGEMLLKDAVINISDSNELRAIIIIAISLQS